MAALAVLLVSWVAPAAWASSPLGQGSAAAHGRALAEPDDAAGTTPWLELGWVELDDEVRAQPEVQLAAFPLLDLPDPLRQLVLVATLGAIALCLRFL